MNMLSSATLVPGLQLQVVLRVAGQLGAARVDHDQGLPLHDLLLDLGAGHRVRIGGVRTDHHDGVRVLQVVDAVGGRAGAEGLLHAEGGGAVAHARALSMLLVPTCTRKNFCMR
jgi:hypothetical protein